MKTIRKTPTILSILLGFLFFVLVFLFHPFRTSFDFNHDEGISLIVSLLIDQGFKPYDSILHDHMLLLPIILGTIFHFTGYSILISRLVIICFSALIVLSASAILGKIINNAAGIAFLGLALLTPIFIEYSTRVMIDIPAVSVSTLAFLFLVLWHLKRSWFFLATSAIFAGLGVLLKLSSVLPLPIFFLRYPFSNYCGRKNNQYPPELSGFGLVFAHCVFDHSRVCNIRGRVGKYPITLFAAFNCWIDLDSDQGILRYKNRSLICFDLAEFGWGGLGVDQ